MPRTFVKEEKIPVGNMAKLRPWANGNVLHHDGLYSVQSTSQEMRISVLKKQICHFLLNQEGQQPQKLHALGAKPCARHAVDIPYFRKVRLSYVMKR